MYSVLRCFACSNFDSDGIDGNHPSCEKYRCFCTIYKECEDFELGIPDSYPVSHEDNKRKAMITAALIVSNMK